MPPPSHKRAPDPLAARLHATLPRSRANGPGWRFVIWFQGCSLGCVGCFNPETHEGGGHSVDIEQLVSQIAAAHDVDGVTVSGGEPFEQPHALLALVRAIRRGTSLSIIVFSGYRRGEIERMATGPDTLAELDVLIDGRYFDHDHSGTALRGSSNQVAHFLTDRYTSADLAATPEAEVTIAPDGSVTVTGVAPVPLRRLTEGRER